MEQARVGEADEWVVVVVRFDSLSLWERVGVRA